MISCKQTQIVSKSSVPIHKPILENLSNQEKLDILLDTTSFTSVKGKARVLFRDATQNERLVVEFEANANQTLLKFKNSIGIEGLHVLIDKDSVLEYNKIDKRVSKMALNQYGSYYAQAYAPIPIMDLLIPTRLMVGADSLSENEENYVVINEPKLVEAVIVKSSRELTRITNIADISSFGEIEFLEYGSIESKRVPRKIFINGTEEAPYRLTLLISELNVLTKSKVLSLSFPSDIQVERNSW